MYIYIYIYIYVYPPPCPPAREACGFPSTGMLLRMSSVKSCRNLRYSVRESDGGTSERGRLPEVISLSPAPEIQKTGKHQKHMVPAPFQSQMSKKHMPAAHYPLDGWSPLGLPGRTQKSIKKSIGKHIPTKRPRGAEMCTKGLQNGTKMELRDLPETVRGPFWTEKGRHAIRPIIYHV